MLIHALCSSLLRGFESTSELYRSSDRRRSAKLVPTLADRGCQVVSATSPSDHNFDFLDLGSSLHHTISLLSLLCLTGSLVTTSSTVASSCSMSRGFFPHWLADISPLDKTLPGHSLMAHELHSLTAVSRLLTLVTTLYKSQSHTD
jgi:hypothetical protein